MFLFTLQIDILSLTHCLAPFSFEILKFVLFALYLLLCSICAEFAVIKERALKVPETSEELQEMMTFVEQARTVGMIKLNERIKVCFCGEVCF